MPPPGPGEGFSRCPTSVEAILPVLQKISDDGLAPISKDHPGSVFIVGRGMVPFTVDETGHVIELK